MSRLSYIAVGVLLAVVFSTAGCDGQKPSERMLEEGANASEQTQSAEGDQEPVAIINGEVVTHAEFERRIQQLAPFARARLSSVEKRKDFLDSVVQFEILADEAEKRGYGDDPAVIQAMKDVMVRKMIQEEVRDRVSMADITDEQVESYYREHKSKYRQPEARRTLLLLVETEQEAQKIRADLVENQPDATDQRVLEFRKLAAQLSTNREAAREGGDVGWIAHPDSRPERIKLSREVFALEQAGDVTEPFQLKDQWALASFFEKRSGSDKRLEDVQQSIRETLYERAKKQARDAFVAELKDNARVERHEDVLESVEPPETKTTPTLDKVPTIPVRDLRGDRGANKASESSNDQN